MPRWIAIGTAPGWDDLDKFRDEMSESSKWRPDPRTTITTVTALADGRMLAECHAVEQSLFDARLEAKGWNVESVTPITHLAQAGSVWEIK